MNKKAIAALVLSVLLPTMLFTGCTNSPAPSPSREPDIVTTPEAISTPEPEPLSYSATVSQNEVQNDYKAEDGTVVLRLHLSIPEIENPAGSPALSIINDYYAGETANHISYAETILYDMALQNYRDSGNTEFRPLVSTQEFKIGYNKNGILSIARRYLDSWDGLDGDMVIKAQTFDTEKGGQIIADDLFSVPEAAYTERILGEILSQVEAHNGTAGLAYYENYRELVRTCFQKDNFYLADTGIFYFYPAYSITADVCEFVIPYEPLSDILKPQVVQ